MVSHQHITSVSQHLVVRGDFTSDQADAIEEVLTNIEDGICVRYDRKFKKQKIRLRRLHQRLKRSRAREKELCSTLLNIHRRRTYNRHILSAMRDKHESSEEDSLE